MVFWNFKATKCWAKKGNQWRERTEDIENILEDKVACVEENLGHIESCIQEMYGYWLNPAFIEDKLIDLEDWLRQSKSRWHRRETRWNMRWMQKEARYNFPGKSKDWRRSSNFKGTQSEDS